MNIIDVIVALLLGLAIGIMTGAGCARTGMQNEAAGLGHAEYYVSTNNFSREWRWK